MPAPADARVLILAADLFEDMELLYPVYRLREEGATVVVADIEPGWADDKTRPDGSDLFLARRPRLYGPPAGPPTGNISKTTPPPPNRPAWPSCGPEPP